MTRSECQYMGKRASLIHQVEYLAQRHEAFGESKQELKENKDFEEIGNKLFSINTMKSFISASDTFVKFVKQIDPSVKMLRDIKPDHFKQYMDKIDKLTERTKHSYLNQLERLNHYIQNDYRGKGFITPENRPVNVDRWKSIHTRTDRALAYDSSSREKLENHLPNRTNEIEILSHSGLRKSELDALKVKNIDFEAKTIHIESGKGGRERTVPLRPEIESRLKELVSNKSLDSRAINVKTDTIQREISQINKKYDLPSRSLHSLRHEYALREYKERYEAHRRSRESKSVSRIKARREVSALLGHGRVGSEKAILTGKGDAGGRISVTYEYITGGEGQAIEAEVEARL